MYCSYGNKYIKMVSRYSSLTEWRAGDIKGYTAAKRNGMLDEICEIMGWNKQSSVLWTHDKCLEEALKHQSISEWQKNSMSSYAAAHKNKWLIECCAHMVSGVQKPKGYWLVKENCIEEALKYTTKKEWGEKSSSSYQSAKKNGWYDECCQHMDIRPVTPPDFWTLEKCIEEAKKCKTKLAFNENLSVVYAARKNGWYEECSLYLSGNKKSISMWTKEEVLEIAKRHKNRTDWMNDNLQSYKIACKNKWIEECTAHMDTRSKWTKENCLKEALKYETMSEWRTNSYTSYSVALKDGFIKECSSHMKKSDKWSKTKCLNEAKKYVLVGDWRRYAPTTYKKAVLNGWLDECTSHMTKLKPQRYWSKDRILKEAKKYSSLTEWCKRGGTSYLVAQKKGWDREIFPE